MWFKGSTFFMKWYNINSKWPEKLRMCIAISGVTMKTTARDIAKKTIARLKWSLKILK